MSGNLDLTSGRLLARNSLLNLAGESAPFLVAAMAIPVLIHEIGLDRYGVLTLIMLAVGYFGVFNLGLDSAATKFIAVAAASSDHRDIPGLFWASLFLMLGFGLCGAILLAALSPWLVDRVLNIAPALRGESLHGFYLLALALPFVVSGGSISGTLSAFQRFDLINAVRLPAGILYSVGPILVLPFSHNLGWIVAVVVLIRLASWIANLAICLHILPRLRREFGVHRSIILPMLRFGGWVTISGIVLPIMEYVDRFIIGAMLSVAAVAYYAVPYQVTNKLRVVPAALSEVTFPAFSGVFSRNPARAIVLFERATRYIMLALFPPILIIVTLAPEGLTLWIGPSFSAHSAAVMRWLALAIFINSLAWTPYTLLPAAHRPDLPAKLYLVEIPGFLLLLWLMLLRYGVAGAAAAFALRTAIEAVSYFLMACQLLPGLAPGVIRTAKTALLALVVLVIGMLPMGVAMKGLFLTTMSGLYALACWTILLEPEEKEFVRSYLRTARSVVIGAAE